MYKKNFIKIKLYYVLKQIMFQDLIHINFNKLGSLREIV